MIFYYINHFKIAFNISLVNKMTDFTIQYCMQRSCRWGPSWTTDRENDFPLVETQHLQHQQYLNAHGPAEAEEVKSKDILSAPKRNSKTTHLDKIKSYFIGN